MRIAIHEDLVHMKVCLEISEIAEISEIVEISEMVEISEIV